MSYESADVNRVLLEKVDGQWEWKCTPLSGGEDITGSGFETAQDALADAAQNEIIKRGRFIAIAEKDEFFEATVLPEFNTAIDELTADGDPDPHMDE